MKKANGYNDEIEMNENVVPPVDDNMLYDKECDHEQHIPTYYTEEQARAIYQRGQTDGFISALKQVRSDVINYLNDSIVSLMSNSSGCSCGGNCHCHDDDSNNNPVS